MAIISWVRRRSGYYGHARRSPDIFRRTRGCVPEGRHVLAGAHGPAAGLGRDERGQPGQHHAVPRHHDANLEERLRHLCLSFINLFFLELAE